MPASCRSSAAQRPSWLFELTHDDCEICHGSRWKSVTVDGVERMTRCDCWLAVVKAKSLAESRIPPKFAKAELATYKPDTDSQREALRLAKKFVESFPAEQKGLVFFGPPGVGKTHLAIGLLKAVIRDKGARGYFFQTTELLRLVRETYNRGVDETEMEVLRPGARGRRAGARRSRRRKDLGVGAGNARPGDQHALQRAPRHHRDQQSARPDRQHRHELVHGAARRALAVALARDVRVGRSAGRRHPRYRARHQRRQDRTDARGARAPRPRRTCPASRVAWRARA